MSWASCAAVTSTWFIRKAKAKIPLHQPARSEASLSVPVLAMQWPEAALCGIRNSSVPVSLTTGNAARSVAPIA